jgi:hypothetical protein
MKNKFTLFLILILSVLIQKGYSQCSVKTNNRPDGVTIKYMNPQMVGKGTGCELGVSISSNGKDYYLNTTILYFGTPVNSTGTLMIELSNHQSLNLTLYSSELATIESSEISANVYLLSKADVDKLKNNIIKKIIFKEAGGKNQIVILSKNFDVASRQINCLEGLFDDTKK